MRKMNAVRVLHDIRSYGPTPRSRIARRAGLSKPTVTDVVDYLHDKEIVRLSQAEQASGGHRAPLYEFNAQKHCVLGIDIGGDKLMAMVTDLDGTALRTERRDTSHLIRSPEALMSLVGETAHSALKAAGTDPENLLAVTVGTPGVVSPTGTISLAPQLAGWEGFDLRGALATMFDCRVHVEREVTLCLLAEQWLGVAQDFNDALFVQLGVGVGAGLLMNGQAYRGANGAAGEIGLMPIGGSQRGLDLTRFGTFESAVGGDALAQKGAAVARAQRTGYLAELAAGDPASVTAKMIFQAAAADDEAASLIVSDALDVLAEGIASLVCTFNPEAVILSGGISRVGEQLRGPLEQRVTGLVPFPPRFLTSRLGEESVVLGAIRKVTQTIEHDLIFDEEEKSQ